jgi:hypothetical protein
LCAGRNGLDLKLSRVRCRKIAFAVVQKHGYQVVSPCRNQNEVESTVAIYVARQQHQPAGRARDSYRLQPALAELKGDPVARMEGVEARDLRRGKIRLPIAVEIADRKLRVRYCGVRILLLSLGSTSVEVTAAGRSYMRNREHAAHRKEKVHPPLPGRSQPADNLLWHQ